MSATGAYDVDGLEGDVRRLCRSVNTRIVELSGERAMILCECAQRSCFVNVELPAADFRAACARHGTYVVAPGHVYGAALVIHGCGYDLVRVSEVTPKQDELVADLVGLLPGRGGERLQHPHVG